MSSPSLKDGKLTSHVSTVPSEEADAKIASVSDTIIPLMHVTPFLCEPNTCDTCLHYNKQKEGMKEDENAFKTIKHIFKSCESSGTSVLPINLANYKNCSSI